MLLKRPPQAWCKRGMLWGRERQKKAGETSPPSGSNLEAGFSGSQASFSEHALKRKTLFIHTWLPFPASGSHLSYTPLRLSVPPSLPSSSLAITPQSHRRQECSSDWSPAFAHHSKRETVCLIITAHLHMTENRLSQEPPKPHIVPQELNQTPIKTGSNGELNIGLRTKKWLMFTKSIWRKNMPEH